MIQITPPLTQTVDKQHFTRIDFVDTAKGICIILVVLMHCGIAKDFPLIGMLRMPFYFTISGIFFKKYENTLFTILKKVNKLLVPFIFFYSLFFLIYIALTITSGAAIERKYFDFIFSKEFINEPLWFLLALFWANLFFLVVFNITRKVVLLGLFSIILSTFSIIFFSGGNNLPLCIDSGMEALPFFFLGYCLKRTDILIPNKIDAYNKILIPVLIGLAALIYFVGNKPHMDFRYVEIIGNPALFVVGATSLVIAVMLLCKELGSLPIINFIGRYSIIILGTHYQVTALLNLVFKQFNVNVGNFPLFVCTLIISVLLIKPFIKIFPKFTAQKDLFPLTYKRKEIIADKTT